MNSNTDLTTLLPLNADELASEWKKFHTAAENICFFCDSEEIFKTLKFGCDEDIFAKTKT